MRKQLPQRYNSFEDFPNNVKKKIRTITKGDLDAFVREPIEAAGNRSLLDIINERHGEEEVVKKLNRMICGH